MRNHPPFKQDPPNSNPPPPQIQPKSTAAGRQKSLDSLNELRLSVILDRDSVDRFIMRRSDQNSRGNKKDRETDQQQEKTKSMGKPGRFLATERREEVQATLKPTASTPSDPERPLIIPSQIKSLPFDKEEYQMKIRLARERNRQSRQANQTFTVDRNLIPTQKELTICGTKVYFPHQPYEVQVAYMEEVLRAVRKGDNALLQSPTGTGKTLCLLASVLSFVEKEYREKNMRHNVIYLSRTHSQLRQVQKELAKTCYRPNMAIFASREQLCLKESLNGLRGKEKVEACGRGVKLARRALKPGKTNEQMDEKTKEAACEFYKEKEEVISIARQKLANKLLDIEIMKQLGRQEIFCPYFYPNHTKGFTTLFIMPYNYILDEFLLRSYSQIIEDSIIIFDEAHNISEAACEGRSLQLDAANIDNAILQLSKILSKFLSPSLQSIRDRYHQEINQLLAKVEDLKETFACFSKEMFGLQDDRFRRESNRGDEPDAKMIGRDKTDIAIFQLFCGKVADQRRKEFQSRGQFFHKTMEARLVKPIEQFSEFGQFFIEQLKETPDGVFSNFQRILAFVKKLKSLIVPRTYRPEGQAWLEEELNHYRVYVTKTFGAMGESYTVGLKCLVPWLTFKDILNFRPRSILLTSGTLRPLPMWEKELRIKFGSQLSNKHVITPQQIAAKVIKNGPAKTRFTFTFENMNKNKNEIYRDLIDFLVQSAANIPHGILLVFPSFRIQMDFKYQLQRSPKRERLNAIKDVIFQQRSTDINMNDFKRKALSAKGAILGIICRGKVSEGIDFPDGMCRAVFIIGIPYANVKDVFIAEKRNHLDNILNRSKNRSQSISGQQWYIMGTARAINQALGRVIRHAADYGMVFLLDSRYADHRQQKDLPEWIKQSMAIIQQPDAFFYDSIGEFYKEMGQKFKPKEGAYEKQYQQEKEEKKPVNALDMLMRNLHKGKQKRPQMRHRIKDQGFDF